MDPTTRSPATQPTGSSKPVANNYDAMCEKGYLAVADGVRQLLGNSEPEIIRQAFKIPSSMNLQANFRQVLANKRNFYVVFCLKLAESPHPEFTIIKTENRLKISGLPPQMKTLEKTVEIWRSLLWNSFQYGKNIEIVVLKKKEYFFFKEKADVIELMNEAAETGCPDRIFTKEIRTALCNVIEMGATCQEVESKHQVRLYAHQDEAESESFYSLQVTWNP